MTSPVSARVKVIFTQLTSTASAQSRICDLTGLAPLPASSGDWFAQMTTAPLPVDTDMAALTSRFYDEYRIEVPRFEWNSHKLMRVSIQGYNTKKDMDRLLFTLSKLFQMPCHCEGDTFLPEAIFTFVRDCSPHDLPSKSCTAQVPSGKAPSSQYLHSRQVQCEIISPQGIIFPIHAVYLSEG